jgi:hypothetical protein
MLTHSAAITISPKPEFEDTCPGKINKVNVRGNGGQITEQEEPRL